MEYLRRNCTGGSNSISFIFPLIRVFRNWRSAINVGGSRWEFLVIRRGERLFRGIFYFDSSPWDTPWNVVKLWNTIFKGAPASQTSRVPRGSLWNFPSNCSFEFRGASGEPQLFKGIFSTIEKMLLIINNKNFGETSAVDFAVDFLLQNFCCRFLTTKFTAKRLPVSTQSTTVRIQIQQTQTHTKSKYQLLGTVSTMTITATAACNQNIPSSWPRQSTLRTTRIATIISLF